LTNVGQTGHSLVGITWPAKLTLFYGIYSHLT